MNTRYTKSILLQIAVISGVFLASPFFASALTLSPPRLEIQGNPGQTITKEMTMTNDEKVPKIFYVSYSNFEAQGETGNPAFVEPKDDLGTWMSSVSSVTLSPGESKVVPFVVNIPKDAEPGGHFAALFWGTSQNKPGGGEVSIGAKIGMLVLLSVSGDVKEEAGLLSFSTKDNKFFYSTLPVSLEYRFKNDGGDRIKPQGKITIRDTIFLPAERLDANISGGNVLPGSTRKFTTDWIKYERTKDYVTPTGFFNKFASDVGYQWKNFAVGLYSANLNIAYGTAEQHVKKTKFFFVFPWQLVLVMLVVFIIVFWGGKKLIKRYNKFIIEKARAGMRVPPSSHNV